MVQEAVYQTIRNEAFVPDYQEWGDEVRDALEEDLLTKDANHEYGFCPNEERPKVRDAMTRIQELKNFLEHQCSEQFLQRGDCAVLAIRRI